MLAILRLAALALVGLVDVHSVVAQGMWSPPGTDPVDLAHAALKREAVPSLRVGDFQITLGRTSLSKVADQFKLATGERGDAGDFLKWVCVTGSDKGGQWILWFESGEIHGGDVGGFQLRRLGTNDAVDQRCRAITAVIGIPSRLSLGMSRERVEQILGKTNGNAMFEFVYERMNRQDITTVNSIRMQFGNGTVVSIDVWKTVTN
jgi:hypothetical protein